jgi:sterol desaturase/sphingolipid hydroxylase (fatty acid hydroxylase superfamily)
MLAAILVGTLVAFIYYWLHRLQHESLFWWRIHATHHHITKMGAARGDRTHPLEFLALMIGTPIVLALTGASDAVIAVTGAFGFFTGILNHSNLPLRSGFYGLYFATTEMHHLHHSRDMDSSNSNYGCSIIIWDRLFGTFSDRTDIAAIGAGSGKPLSILNQYKMAFVSKQTLVVNNHEQIKNYVTIQACKGCSPEDFYADADSFCRNRAACECWITKSGGCRSIATSERPAHWLSGCR